MRHSFGFKASASVEAWGGTPLGGACPSPTIGRVSSSRSLPTRPSRVSRIWRGRRDSTPCPEASRARAAPSTRPRFESGRPPQFVAAGTVLRSPFARQLRLQEKPESSCSSSSWESGVRLAEAPDRGLSILPQRHCRPEPCYECQVLSYLPNYRFNEIRALHAGIVDHPRYRRRYL